MWKYLLSRLAAMAATLLVICAVVFVIFYVFPTSPAESICGKGCSPGSIRAINHTLGLDKSLYAQFGDYLKGVFAGRTYGTAPHELHCAFPCLGFSYQSNATVTSLLWDRLAVSASIAVGASVLFLVSGVLIGTVASLYRGTRLDRWLMGGSLAASASPTFLTAIVLLFLLSGKLHILPSPHYVAFADSPAAWFQGLLLPWVTLAFANAAHYARYTRGSMVESMSQDYVRTARAKGAGMLRLVTKHGMRAGLTPVVTVFGLQFAGLMGGTIIVETVFGFSGLGQLFIQAVNTTDIPIVLGVTLLTAVLVLVANLVVDLLYAVLNPRARSGGNA
ncbi:ABC transporter permease [Streptomyces sp. NPDC048445]|uniref:ABC transporter permease n=1 Tax=Streptomyces sp. NPDC048445 TaxID=3365553 RepID=UPI0037222BDA